MFGGCVRRPGPKERGENENRANSKSMFYIFGELHRVVVKQIILNGVGTNCLKHSINVTVKFFLKEQKNPKIKHIKHDFEKKNQLKNYRRQHKKKSDRKTTVHYRN